MLASCWNIRLARADRLSTADSLAARRAAAALAPGYAGYWIRLAHLQQQEGISAVDTYRNAIQASPLDAEAWIGLGLEQELAGDYPAAEQNLLNSTEISREYIPRWTLLNYYFRRNDARHFRPWAKQALTIGSGDLAPIFRMAWALDDDGGRIAREVLPDRTLVLAQYLAWLTSAGKLEPARTIFDRLIREAGEQEVPSLLFYCNEQLSKGDVPAARAAWTALVARRLIGATEDLTAVGLVNGQFSHEPLNSGFDWRIANLDGLTIRATLPGLRVTFAGREPEACEIISQYVPLESARSYELAYEYQTAGAARDSGLAWRIFDARTGLELTSRPPGLARDRMGWESMSFVTPPGVSGGRLALTYRRGLGTTRIKGWLRLRQVALRAAN